MSVSVLSSGDQLLSTSKPEGHGKGRLQSDSGLQWAFYFIKLTFF